MIEELVKDNDGLIRSALIKTANYGTTRPIVKLYPLEVADNVNDIIQDTHTVRESEDTSASNVAADPPPAPTREKRTTTTKALKKISKWTEILRCPTEDVE